MIAGSILSGTFIFPDGNKNLITNPEKTGSHDAYNKDILYHIIDSQIILKQDNNGQNV